MRYDLTRLGERRFEDLCRALAVHVLGTGIQAFGDGPDGGREAAFAGRLAYPGPPGERWDGYGVLQAEYRRGKVGTKDAEWLRGQVTREIAAWADPRSRRVTRGRIPQYLIIATNVSLSSVTGSGGIDQILAVLANHGACIGLNGWALWEANQLTTYLNAFPMVSTKFAEFVTAGDVLAKALRQLDRINTNVDRPRFRVGQSQPVNHRAITRAYEAAGGEDVLGEPCSELFDDGPGVVQYFVGALTGGHGPAVICARYGRPAVAVVLDVWDAISVAGAGNGVQAVGYPVVQRDTPPFIPADVDRVELDGGRWGPGEIVRRPDGRWRWQPRIAWTLETQVGDRWLADLDRMNLCLRCAVRIEWNAEDMAIDGAGHRLLRSALPDSWLHEVVVVYASGKFGLDTASVAWERTPDREGRNDRRSASYRLRIPGVDGRTAIGAWARFVLPEGSGTTVLSVVDVRFDFAAMPGQPDPCAGALVDPGHRVDSDRLLDILQSACEVGVRILPSAVTEDPAGVHLAGPPTIELHLASERAPGNGSDRSLALLDMLDLSGYGEPPPEPKYCMSAAATAPLGLDYDRIEHVVVGTTIFMCESYGFIYLD